MPRVKRQKKKWAGYTATQRAERSRRAALAGTKGALAGHAKRTKEERIEKARHALAARHAKAKTRTAWVMDYVDDRDIYLSKEQFDALP